VWSAVITNGGAVVGNEVVIDLDAELIRN